MPNRADIVREARQWVGTPYHDGGYRRGASCDCIGLVRGTAESLGFKVPRPFPAYGRFPHDGHAEAMADRFLYRSNNRDPLPGQIGIFWWRSRKNAQHFAIFGEMSGRITMIHAYMGLRADHVHPEGQVTEAGVSDFWRKRLMRIYDYREIALALA